MILSAFKRLIQETEHVQFVQSNGIAVPAHFHLTEIGKIQKSFIDCGGVLRQEKKVGFQLWTSNDFEHRLSPSKLLDIIALGEKKLGIGDWEIEVEYQGEETIGKHGLQWNGKQFNLTSLQTDCLAKDNCGVPEVQLNDANYKQNESSCCTPGGGCC